MEVLIVCKTVLPTDRHSHSCLPRDGRTRLALYRLLRCGLPMPFGGLYGHSHTPGLARARSLSLTHTRVAAAVRS